MSSISVHNLRPGFREEHLQYHCGSFPNCHLGGWISPFGQPANISNSLLQLHRNLSIPCKAHRALMEAAQIVPSTAWPCRIEERWPNSTDSGTNEDTAIAMQESWLTFFAAPLQPEHEECSKRNMESRIFEHLTVEEALCNGRIFSPPWIETEPAASRQVEVCMDCEERTPDVVQRCAESCDRTMDNDTSCLWSASLYGSSNVCSSTWLGNALQTAGLVDGQEICPTDIHQLLQTCFNKEDVQAAREVYWLIVRSGLESDHDLVGNVIHLFAFCGSLSEASRIFKRLHNPNAFTWSAILSANAKLGQDEKAINLYFELHKTNLRPDGYVFVAVLKACANIGALTKGKLIHAHIIENAFDSNIFVGNTLVDMYAKCKSLKNACRVFIRLPKRDVVTWAAIIAGYSDCGHGHEALQLFRKMQQEGVKPNQVTFVCILKTCSNLSALDQGKLLHAQILESGFEVHLFVETTLVDMYCKCGGFQEARRLFDRLPKENVVLWSAMIAGLAQQELGVESFRLFQQMQQQGIEPDKVTFVSLLQAFSGTNSLAQGRQIHAHVFEKGFESDRFVGSSLINMYANCESLDDACTVFNRLTKKDLVTWSALIAALVHHGHGKEALEHFWQMQVHGLEPDNVTFLSVLKACSTIAALQQSKLIHAQIIYSGFELDTYVGNALIGMYSRCGSLEDANGVFCRLPERDVVTWSAMIEGFAQHSNYELALQSFVGMQQEGLKPDGVSFLCLISACSRVGLVDEGRHQFKLMTEKHGIAPKLEHYTCMVDLLGRGGHLEDAEVLLETMPFQPNIVGWIVLLGHCRTHSNVELGKRCFDHVVSIDHNNAACYVLMSNIYTHAGLSKDAYKVEELRKRANAWKKPAKAFIEIENMIHEFTVGDKSHPQSEDIYSMVERLTVQVKDEGYLPLLESLHPLDQDKEEALCGHCEKLAIALGLISTPTGTTIRVSKNLRMCIDCHSATKIISKIERREIIVTDAYCVHSFKDGTCSCKSLC